MVSRPLQPAHRRTNEELCKGGEKVIGCGIPSRDSKPSVQVGDVASRKRTTIDNIPSITVSKVNVIIHGLVIRTSRL